MPGLETLALYGVGGMVVFGALWGLYRIVKKSGASEVAADMNESVVKNVEKANRARNDPANRKRVRDKYRRR